MQTRTRQEEPTTDDRPVVRACESRPGRTVLIESENSDGWIASELVVDTETYR